MIDDFVNDIISENYGQPVSVTCGARGIPQPVLSWYKDGTIINSALSTNIDIVYTIIDNATVQSVLSLSFTSDNDEGVYRCVGTNNLPNGTVVQSRSFTLDVVGGKSNNVK